jgi:Xaa-Pro aminopeptidase
VKRIENFFSKIESNNIDAFFVTATPNIRYLTGFTGEDAFLLAVNKRLLLIVDSRFTTQAQNEVYDNVEVLEYQGNIVEFVKNLLLKYKIHWLGVEKNRLSANIYLLLSNIPFVKVVPLENMIELLRIKKENEEVDTIRKACAISSKSFTETLTFIKEGITEKDIAAELEYRFRKNGADKLSFDTIVAAGERGALPHGTPSERKIKAHELIVMDFGVFFNGYASDTTRTVCIGEPDEESLKVYNIVKNAQKLGREMVKKGVYCKDLDGSVRDYITKQGYGEYFIHGLGHGVGLEIHELPFVNSRSPFELDENMIITVEPGIYLPNKFGVRIEDTILVKKNSGEVLTDLPHDLIVL